MKNKLISSFELFSLCACKKKDIFNNNMYTLGYTVLLKKNNFKNRKFTIYKVENEKTYV